MEWTRINEVALLMCVTPGPRGPEVFTGEKDMINLSGTGWLKAGIEKLALERHRLHK